MKVKSLVIIMFALIAGYNVYSSQKSDVMSDWALANVEALADDNELSDAHWNREDYTLDNGTPAANCWSGGSSDCILR